MAFAKQLNTAIGIVGIWELSESSDQLRNKFSFSRTEKEEFSQLKIEKRKVEYLSVRLLLEKIVGRKAELNYSKTGKPYIKDSNLHVSISHSAELAVVFLSEKNAGIDAENIFRNTQKAGKRYLSEPEYQTAMSSKHAALARIMYWSAKEAIFKCTPEQEISFANQIKIFPFNIQNEGELSGRLETAEKFRKFHCRYLFYGNNVIVYCVEA